MTHADRFSYHANLDRATRYRDQRNALWPPAGEHRLVSLDLAEEAPLRSAAFLSEIETIRRLVDAEWDMCKALGVPSRTRLHEPKPIADAMRRLAALLPPTEDRRALRLRADAVEHGYAEAALEALAAIGEDIAFVAGQIATWYGKQAGGLPTAFGCVRDAGQQAAVETALAEIDAVGPYLRRLHAHLALGEVPAFLATRIFFMAGEGNKHPKHIAYFLPEDEGVKRSPFKKTYYFVNTHRALLGALSLPLAARFLDLGRPVAGDAAELEPIPTLGVLAHEIGHFVHREGAGFAAINRADRWASVVLQEAAADVFGTLILAELVAPRMSLSPADIVGYYLAECLRYVDRGLGLFPDSDGMYLQLAYFVQLGALRLKAEPNPQLVGNPEIVIAALRSLARVLADTLLNGDAERSVALHRTYGPAAADGLAPILAALRERPQTSIEYIQEYVASNHPAVIVTESRQRAAQ